ncbi:sensor domain-containing diguanylate cyclase [Thiomicrorhabdus sp.]|uniref:sensor domain-containing diguanylate cyclase n=1 Tax=Thiomicrorhabdus sp. TaxID=2039724 RepID=UPI002AA86AB6|nr:sensor domain-containing diguanylate cyclase [Thiomicrorhabdus sp.]
MYKSSHNIGQNLIRELESILNDIHRYSDMVNQHVITSSTDINGIITNASEAFCKSLGYSDFELIGKHFSYIKHPNTPASIFSAIWKTIELGKSWKGEIQISKKNNEAYWVDMNIDPIKNSTGQITGYLFIKHDITDHKRIESLTITDELTGAYNRRFYNQSLPKEIDRARRESHFLCLMMMDVDNFKKYNDTYGHQAGDEVLKEIVTSAQACFQRAGDFVFRLGGEEFAVLFSVDESQKARLIAERCRRVIQEKSIEHSGNDPYFAITVSVGIMILDPKNTYITEEIYKYADEALYAAKRNGRNCVVVHETDNDIEFF